MSAHLMQKFLRKLCILACLATFGFAGVASASEYHGQVVFGTVPVPGATVTATQGTKKFTAITDDQGAYSFADLPDGAWKITIEMTCFAPLEQDVTIAPAGPGAPSPRFELKMLPLDQILAQTKIVKPEAKPEPIVATTIEAPKPGAAAKPADTAAPEPPKPADDASAQSSDGLLINGSVNNAATSQFTLAPAFGNQRKGAKALYTGNAGVIYTNSAFNANAYSLTGLQTPKPEFNQITMTATVGGPLRIPHLLPRGPNFTVGYQWTRDSNDSNLTYLVPTLLQRSTVPANTIASKLLAYYPTPQPNIPINSGYNYQAPVLGNTHVDALQSRLDKTLGTKNQVYGGFSFQSNRSNSTNLFGFTDTTNVLGLTTNINWQHRFNSHLFVTTGYRFSRQRTQVRPFFEGIKNVSADAGITSNDQEATTWGPPTLTFSSGIATLSDANSSFNRNRTDAYTGSANWFLRRHNFSFGADFRRQEFNINAQSNPRGVYTFTGQTTGGTDFGNFAAGIPDASSVAYGNADKYFRQSVYDGYAADDWRIRPELTINAGLRWEYGSPITELFGRLVNLDIAPGFAAATPVLGSSPTGALTGSKYPTSLIRPDKAGIEPRIALSWRPIPGSSLVIRSGYGIYQDTSVYVSTATQMAQQAPLSRSLSVQNSAACPLTLATGFNPPGCTSATVDPFAVDPNFHVGYAQSWQVSAQRDLPFALQMTATYLGIKGTHGVQAFLPNTYPICTGATCPTPPAGYPVGFTYRTSGGNSTRQAGSFQLRRRLRSGFTATALYTYAKAIDDDAVLGGQGPVASGSSGQSQAAASIAQNWLNIRGERSRSSFDQRHLLNAQLQYTSGQGLGGGTLMHGWRGTLLKEWTFQGNLVLGTGLPETPTYLATVPHTSTTGSIRASVTGASPYAAPAGLHLNPAAYTAPANGQWGTAGRNSITGPNQFTFNASLARNFRLDKRFSLDTRLDTSNILNHPVTSAWNSVVNSPQFGARGGVNAMRSMEITTRLRF